MKSLSKLRLINWHYFTNTTTPIKNITFLTGSNGTGKSTIVDALQIVILGSTAPSNFNKAAHEKGRSGRNLISYLRGATGIDGDNNYVSSRTGVFSSYIAIELYDDENKKTETLGILFDVDQSDVPDKHFFYLNSPFPECDFSTKINGKIRPMNYKEFSSYLNSNYKKDHFRFFTTDNEYRAFSKGIFGNLSDNYFSLFKQAVAFAPISNIKDFITEYIWDGDVRVNIDPLKNNIEQYKILQGEAKRLREKKETLEKISVTHQEYLKRKKEHSLLSYLFDRVNYEEKNIVYQKITTKLQKNKERLSEVNSLINIKDKELEDLKVDLASYQAQLYKSDSYSLAEKINLQKNSLASNITSIQMTIEKAKNNIKDTAEQYKSTCLSFVSYYNNFDSLRLKNDKIIKQFNSLLDLCDDIHYASSEIIEKTYNDTLDFIELNVFKNNMDTLKQNVSALQSLLSDTIYDLSIQLVSLKNDLNAVNSGKKPFDKLGPSYNSIKNELEQALKASHPDAKIDIFCDLIDVIDSEWQKAIEAVLFGQKFNFFVKPEYYEEAHKILKNLCSKYDYYRVSLVDTEKLLKADIRAYDDSVATLVESPRKDAQVYADYLLGNIKKCDTFEQARSSGYGLLKDCTGYRSYATWYLNKENARIYFIGTKVSSSTISSSASDYSQTNNLSSLYIDLKNKLSEFINLPTMSENELRGYESDLARSKEVHAFQTRIDSLDQEIENVGNGELVSAQAKIDEINSNINNLSTQRDELITEKGKLQTEISFLEENDIPNTQSQLKEFEKAFSKVDQKVIDEEYEPFFNRLLDEQKKTLSDIQNEAKGRILVCQNSINQLENSLRRYKNDYVNRYHVNYNIDILEKNDEFDQELDSISNVKLPQYEEKIATAHDQSIKEFKADFIYKLRTSIEAVTSRIDELNSILDKKQFGRDRYEFSVKPSKIYRQYYNMIMDEDLLKKGDAETLFMEKYKSAMNELFAIISSSTTNDAADAETIRQNIETYTSYTTYIDFDLFVKKKSGDKEEIISLSRSIQSQSGGETQTPFYLSILASFASITRANNQTDNNTLRLVILDEAFTKMDADRIKNSVSLLREFGLQAIISTPGEKLPELIRFVDLILVTINDSRRKISDLDTYEEKNSDKILIGSELPKMPNTNEDDFFSYQREGKPVEYGNEYLKKKKEKKEVSEEESNENDITKNSISLDI